MFLSLNQLLNHCHKGMEMFCALGSGYPENFNCLCIWDMGVWVDIIRGLQLTLVPLPLMLDQSFRITVQMSRTKCVGREMGLFVEERDGALRG